MANANSWIHCSVTVQIIWPEQDISKGNWRHHALNKLYARVLLAPIAMKGATHGRVIRCF
jgi:hypothetical protein